MPGPVPGASSSHFTPHRDPFLDTVITLIFPGVGN